MAIQEITDTEIVQRCAGCDRENRVALANLAGAISRLHEPTWGAVCSGAHARVAHGRRQGNLAAARC
jgi:hypothetical protein